MTTEERFEINQLATELAYEEIRHSGLNRSLSNEEWDELAKVLGQKVQEVMDVWVDQKFTEIEAASQAAVAA